MNFELKDLFQFGVPTGLLVLVIWRGLPLAGELWREFLVTIKEGFSKVETSAKERDDRWRDLLGQIHRETRDDRSEDRELRKQTNETVNKVMLRLQGGGAPPSAKLSPGQ